jgi:cytohesin
VNAKDEDGETPLDRADGGTADLLRKHGGKTKKELEGGEPVAEAAKPERQARKVPDTIHEAAKKGNIEAVKQHLAAGTDVNAKASRGWTPLHSVATKEIAELLIAKGADVNAKKDDGEIPLHYAAFVSHKEIVELLIAKGADVNAKDKDDETPLDEPIISMLGLPGGHSEIADLLRKHGGKTGEELKAEGK